MKKTITETIYREIADKLRTHLKDQVYCAAVFADESEDYAEILGNIHDNPELLNE